MAGPGRLKTHKILRVALRLHGVNEAVKALGHVAELALGSLVWEVLLGGICARASVSNYSEVSGSLSDRTYLANGRERPESSESGGLQSGSPFRRRNLVNRK